MMSLVNRCAFLAASLCLRARILGEEIRDAMASANACGLFGATYTTPLPSARRCGGVSLVITAHPAAWTDTPCWEPRAVPSGCWRKYPKRCHVMPLFEVVLPARPIRGIRRYSTLRKVNGPHHNLGLCDERELWGHSSISKYSCCFGYDRNALQWVYSP